MDALRSVNHSRLGLRSKYCCWLFYMDMLNVNVNTHSCFNRIDESVRHADRFFTNRNGLFDVVPACWQHMIEEERRKLCSLFDTFTGSWSVATTLAEPSATTTNNKWMLDKHFSGFAFAPNHLLNPFLHRCAIGASFDFRRLLQRHASQLSPFWDSNIH